MEISYQKLEVFIILRSEEGFTYSNNHVDFSGE